MKNKNILIKIVIMISLMAVLSIPFFYKKSKYDVVIVGGGLAGLSSAYKLNNCSVLILEKNDRLGGRVWTKKYENINYDLGAIFYYDTSSLPFDISQNLKLIKEQGPLGILCNDNIIYGNTVEQCIKNMKLSKEQLAEIKDFKNVKNKKLSEPVYKILNSFFKVIYPVDMNKYIYERKLDAFETYDISHYDKGNSSLVNEFKNHMNADVRLNCNVVSVVDNGDSVEIIYLKDKKRKRIFAKYVIVTPPAPIASKIIKYQNKDCKKFLTAVKYGSFIMTAVAVENFELPDFSYIVTPDLKTNAVLKHHTKNKNITMLIACYGDAESKNMYKYSDKKILDITVKQLNKIFKNRLEYSMIAFSDVVKWNYGGTVINNTFKNFKRDVLYPTQRVFLSGDYVYIKKDRPIFPYGMMPAIMSGLETGLKIKMRFKFKNN